MFCVVTQKIFLNLLILVSLFYGCYNVSEEKQNQSKNIDYKKFEDLKVKQLENEKPFEKEVDLQKITARVIKVSDNTFGYEIAVNGKPLIRQTNIPGSSGTDGFSDSIKALRVGDYVADKLRHNIKPPTISTLELDSLLAK